MSNKMLIKLFLYLLAIGFGVFFALYLNAAIGWTFVYILVCSPIFSLIVTYALTRRKRITLTADVNRSMLYKRETTVLRIIAKNKSLLPVPAIKIKLAVPKGLTRIDNEENYVNCVLSISPRSQAVIEIEYKAAVWGICKVGAENAVLHDFMGFFKFAMPCTELLREIKVFPDIPEIEGDAPLLRAASEAAKFSDDNEETKENDGLNTFGGMPGYTHRDYELGDPVRRINWKLSSKRDKYMVRLDDEIESIRQTIVLDPCGGNDVFENERAVEGMLAAVDGLLKCGFEVTVFCRFNSEFLQFEITEPADVSALQTRLADFQFVNTAAGVPYRDERIPMKNLTESGVSRGILLYTPLFDKQLNMDISSAEEQGVTVSVVSSDSVGSGTAHQVWQINEDYSTDIC